ncbi:MAG: branched-chain-amino-acid transaminase [Planctomycetes bacterium]|nr:branched-chain-amino-acid transaminase [Planctomycetota bacterium]MCH8210968.1 branched-chain-amino-acid transaminase [Planctomycetota bacterium]MCH8259637.1 branched-chain-amino-acid transaminase [Planctomycetota bacterium]
MNKVWLDGALVDQDQAKISVFDHAVLYGDGCFEGIRAYNGRIFKLGSHLNRMYESAERIRLDPPYSRQEIEQAIRETVAANNLTDAYIRLVFTRGVGTLGLHPFRCPKATAFIIADTIELYPQALYDNGLRVIVAKRRRIPIESLDPALKSLNYLNNIMAKIEAIDADALEAIMLNTDDYVSECTGDNIFIVTNGRIITPPIEAGILHGITRRFVIEELAPHLKYQICEEMMKLDDVLKADEVFLTGTAAEIIGVNRVDDQTIGSGKVGPVTKSLVTEFRRRVNVDAPED